MAVEAGDQLHAPVSQGENLPGPGDMSGFEALVEPYRLHAGHACGKN
jgi:hypothetical protein